MQAFLSQYIHLGAWQTEELNISMPATDQAVRIDNVEDIKQSVRKMRSGGPEVGWLPYIKRHAYLALEDLIIEYKAALVIIHDCAMAFWG